MGTRFTHLDGVMIMCSMKKFCAVAMLTILGIATLLAGASHARIYYLSPNGSDANDGSRNAPWQSFSHAYTMAGPGDTVFVRGGTYAGEDMFQAMKNARGGTADNRLVIKAYPGDDTPVLNGFSRFGLPAYTRIEGLHFQGTGTGTGGVGMGSGGSQLVNCVFSGEGFGFAAIHATGDDILIEGNTIDVIQSTTLDHGIYVQRGAGKVIRNNTILRCQGYGVHVFDEQKSGDSSQWTPFPIKDVLIENNFISGSEARDGIIVAKGRGGNTIDLSNITIRNNIITGNGRSGIFLREGTNINVYHNTIYQNVAASMGITGPVRDNEDVNNVAVTNNIFVTAGSNQHLIMTSAGANIVVDNNLYWPESNPIEGITDPRAMFADPLLVDPANRDFHILATSPAMDTGVPIESITQDFEGSLRPQFDGYDIGADEFGELTVPVNLTFFEARVEDGAVHLTWETSRETGNFGYEVQRRPAGGAFEGVGFVPAAEDAGSGVRYTYRDGDLGPGRYAYRLKQIDLSGSAMFSAAVTVEIAAPTSFELHQNHPNPFNPTTEITFVVPEAERVRVAVYNLLGQHVRTLFDERAVSPGTRRVTWDGRDGQGRPVPSGLYFYRLESDAVVLSRRMILLK